MVIMIVGGYVGSNEKDVIVSVGMMITGVGSIVMPSRDCWNCHGTGRQVEDGLTLICDVCNGTGQIYLPPKTIEENGSETVRGD